MPYQEHFIVYKTTNLKCLWKSATIILSELDIFLPFNNEYEIQYVSIIITHFYTRDKVTWPKQLHIQYNKIGTTV